MMKAIVQILKYILPFILAWLAVKLIRKIMSKERIGSHLELVLLKSILVALAWIIACFVALSSVDSGLTHLWNTILASASVVSVVLGLAAQETLGNMFAGISMSIGHSKPFSIGDRIKVEGYDPGTVEDFTLRHVVLKTYLNERIYIPNSVVARSEIINYTTGAGGSAYPIEITVAYEADLQKAMSIMADVIFNHPNYYGKEKPTVLCKEAGESGIVLRAVVTTKEFWANPTTCSECLAEIIKQYQQNNIEIPYNKLQILH